MLVLTRKVGECIIIGEGPGRITITVVASDGNRVRVGIEAPRDVPVLRQELVPDADPVKELSN